MRTYQEQVQKWERDKLSSELVSARLDGARLRAALSAKPDPTEELIVPEGASADQAEYNYQRW